MARIVYRHPGQSGARFHVFTDLDFWDARRLLGDLAQVRRNFGKEPPGDEFPTQVVSGNATPGVRRAIEKRLKKAIVSPPRHVIVRAMLEEGVFEFDPSVYYPLRWSRPRMHHFTWNRLPLEQSSLTTPYHTVTLKWAGDHLRVERVRRTQKHDPTIRDRKQSIRRRMVPSCF